MDNPQKMTTRLVSCISILFLYLVTSAFQACGVKGEQKPITALIDSTARGSLMYKSIQPGAEQLAQYVPLLKNKRVGLVVNHSSRVGDTHLIDSLLSLEVDIIRIFTPEHGFTGKADAGEKVEDGKRDEIPLVSLYGEKKRPDDKDLEDVDILVFDLQDVGVRFYTYISTLHYVMEAAGENNIPLLVLDRPNPNGHYVDGPVLEAEFQSFVGMHPIPVVYGMTIGELARMINGEAWLKNGVACDLSVIKNANYSHLMYYSLPIPPSPNLKDDLAIALYPSLCFFEGTPISVGRGTEKPFTVFGHPSFEKMTYSFTPTPGVGALRPKLQGELCYGVDLSTLSLVDFRAKGKLELSWLIDTYHSWTAEDAFFNPNGWFDQLAGTEKFRKMMEEGANEEEIRASWQNDINKFKMLRKRYLLYDDFE